MQGLVTPKHLYHTILLLPQYVNNLMTSAEKSQEEEAQLVKQSHTHTIKT